MAVVVQRFCCRSLHVFDVAEGKPLVEWDIFFEVFFSYRSNEITIRIDGIFFSIPENIVENEERVIGFRFSDIPQYKTDKGGTSNKKEKLLLFFLQIFFTFEFQIDYWSLQLST